MLAMGCRNAHPHDTASKTEPEETEKTSGLRESC